MREAQQDLFAGRRSRGSIDARFEAFIRENPRIVDLFERFALEVIRSGRQRYSADAICHRIRWHVAVETRGDDFKLNDHFPSRLARLFMQKHPQHAGFFETRELRERRAS